MSEEKIQDAEVVSEETKQEPMQVEVTPDVAFTLKLQEYDKNIAAHKAEAAKLEAEKAAFVYNSNVQTVTEQHKEKIIKAQVEEESRKRLSEKKG